LLRQLSRPPLPTPFVLFVYFPSHPFSRAPLLSPFFCLCLYSFEVFYLFLLFLFPFTDILQLFDCFPITTYIFSFFISFSVLLLVFFSFTLLFIIYFLRLSCFSFIRPSCFPHIHFAFCFFFFSFLSLFISLFSPLFLFVLLLYPFYCLALLFSICLYFIFFLSSFSWFSLFFPRIFISSAYKILLSNSGEVASSSLHPASTIADDFGIVCW